MATRSLMLRTNSFRAIFELPSIFASPYCNAYKIESVIACSFSTTNSSASSNFFVDCLIKDFNFSRDTALLVMKRHPHLKSLGKPHSAVTFLRKFGFSEGHIERSVRVFSQILLMDEEKVLKPKLLFFQQMGLSGSDLGEFISNNPSILRFSLDGRLRPCMDIIRKVLSTRATNENLIKVISRCDRVISVDPKSILLSNISILENCGIVGSQLSVLLLRRPRLFTKKEPLLKKLVSQVLDMGFSKDSRMFVHWLYTLSSVSYATLERKFDLLQGFGFSEADGIEMFRKAPSIFRLSGTRLEVGINFFISTCKLKKERLVRDPLLLTYSIDSRVMPRYRVLQNLKARGLLEKEPSFPSIIKLHNDEFLEKFILRFKDRDELMKSYDA